MTAKYSLLARCMSISMVVLHMPIGLKVAVDRKTQSNSSKSKFKQLLGGFRGQIAYEEAEL